MSDAVIAPVLSCRGLAKTYASGPLNVTVLSGVDIEVQPGERIAIVGKSGSGKSTLLHLLGGLDLPSAGTVKVQGRDMSTLGEAERGHFRNATLGFVYQFHHLLMEFTALENVAMPLLIRRMPRDEALGRAKAVLEEVGLGERLEHLPGRQAGHVFPAYEGILADKPYRLHLLPRLQCIPDLRRREYEVLYPPS